MFFRVFENVDRTLAIVNSVQDCIWVGFALKMTQGIPNLVVFAARSGSTGASPTVSDFAGPLPKACHRATTQAWRALASGGVRLGPQSSVLQEFLQDFEA